MRQRCKNDCHFVYDVDKITPDTFFETQCRLLKVDLWCEYIIHHAGREESVGWLINPAAEGNWHHPGPEKKRRNGLS